MDGNIRLSPSVISYNQKLSEKLIQLNPKELNLRLTQRWLIFKRSMARMMMALGSVDTSSCGGSGSGLQGYKFLLGQLSGTNAGKLWFW